MEHLEELRWHLIRSAIVIVVTAIAAFIYKSIVFDILILGPSRKDFFTNEILCKAGHYLSKILPWLIDNPDLLCPNTKALNLTNYDMTGQFTTHIKISVITGLIVGFPYVVYELWKFVKPALYQHERKHSQLAIFSISFLFFTGVLFGYFVICPLSVNFLIGYNLSDAIKNQPNLASYISTVSSIVLASGVIFELPVFVYFLSKIGLVTPSFLKKYRKHSIVVILIIAAFVTPSADAFSQILVSLPLFVLYEICIGISKRVTKNREMNNS